jgi:hypothetical protein
MAHDHQHQQAILLGIHGKNDVIDPHLKIRQGFGL